MTAGSHVALMHAYRAANRGDGWLVDLAMEVVAAAGATDVATYALDPSGMPGDARQVLPPPTAVRAAIAAVASAVEVGGPVARRVARLPEPRVLQAAVGVGGAYLRANDRRHELVFRSHHLPQLEILARLGARGIYLPVSIGPLPPRLDRRVRTLLRRVGTVCVRDDTSADYLTDHPGLVRIPDLAACDIGRARPPLALRSDAIAFVLRELPGSSLGEAVARSLASQGHQVVFGIQSTSGHTNNDVSYYRSIGVDEAAQPFGTLLNEGQKPAVVVAGRLHAALAAIRAGVPTIHLGYERKSWGAFTDLGLGDWIVHAWQAEEATLHDLVQSLLDDPSVYWSSLSERFDRLSSSWDDLVRLTADAVRGP